MRTIQPSAYKGYYVKWVKSEVGTAMQTLAKSVTDINRAPENKPNPALKGVFVYFTCCRVVSLYGYDSEFTYH